jgi:hypothetical protein
MIHNIFFKFYNYLIKAELQEKNIQMKIKTITQYFRLFTSLQLINHQICYKFAQYIYITNIKI